MSAERVRGAAQFFGTFMLAVQGWVLFQFAKLALHELDNTPSIDRKVFFDRLAWLKPRIWSPPWFETYFVVLAMVAATVVLALWVVAIQRWRRERREEA